MGDSRVQLLLSEFGQTISRYDLNIKDLKRWRRIDDMVTDRDTDASRWTSPPLWKVSDTLSGTMDLVGSRILTVDPIWSVTGRFPGINQGVVKTP